MSNGALGRFHPVPREGVAPRPWGVDANRISTIDLDLSVARARKEIKIGGNFLWASDGTDGAANAKISFTDQEADAGISFKRGSAIAGLRFGRIFVTNAAQAGKTLQLSYAVEAPELRIENPAGFFTEVDLTKATALKDAVDVSCGAGARTTVLAANTARRVAFVTNLGATTKRVGNDATVAANRGTPIAQNETIVLEGTFPIAVWNPAAGAEDVAVSWSED